MTPWNRRIQGIQAHNYLFSVQLIVRRFPDLFDPLHPGRNPVTWLYL